MNIEGKNNIKAFCDLCLKEKNLLSLSGKIIEKNLNVTFDTKNGSNLSFDYIKGSSGGNRLVPWKVDLLDHNVRISLSKETDNNDLLETILSDTESNNYFKTFLSNKIKKSYRYKDRYSFITSDDSIQIDMTVVKSSYGNNLLSSNIFKSDEQYQVEIELNSNNLSKSEDFSKVYENFLGFISLLSKIKNKSHLLISNKEQETVRQEYLKISSSLSSVVTKSSMDKRNFIGVDAVSLMAKHLYSTSEVNVLKDYFVTDKADGERMLLFVPPNSESKKVYMINNRLNVMSTGVSMNKSGILVDGEYISSKNLYLSFDILYDNQDVRNKNLESRLKLLKSINIIDEASSSESSSSSSNKPFIFKNKKFYSIK